MCNGGDDFSITAAFECASAKVSYARGVEIYGEHEPSEYFYKILSGAIRTYTLMGDGRRQVCSFYLSTDFFGWETSGSYSVSADAIIDTQLLVIKRRAALALAEEDARIGRFLWTMTGGELKRARAHVLLLVKTARERTAGFLFEMSSRVRGIEYVDLPMGRQDIADYLGLTIETVSRSLAELEGAGIISLVSSRRIALLNREALSNAALCLGTSRKL